jgi:predicted GNAT family N-acyltransferase
MPDYETFEVHALIVDGSNRVRPFREHLEKAEPILGTGAGLKFTVQLMDGTEHLLRLINELVGQAHPNRIVLLSEALAARKEIDGWEATSLSRKIRELFIQHPTHLCGLIALMNDQPHRITDIDAVLKIDDVTPETLKRKLMQVATRLWLKSPVAGPSIMTNRDAIRVHRVQSEAQLKECFRLRHRVYDALGYLEEPVSRSASKIDVDSFDTKAIHFAAVDYRSGDFVGTARLVTTVPRYMGQTVIGDPWRVIRDHADWAKAIARQALVKEDRVFREKINQCINLPFPILLNSDFGTKYRKLMEQQPPAFGGEVSRVIVSPFYRGLGISALLMRAVISTAFHLQKKFLLLECVPAHARMYEKYGFRLIEGHHCRAQDLDQIAVGMSLSLDDHPFNKTVALAKSDGEMLRKSGFLCLCRNSDCWKRREFEFRRNESRCPLVEIHRGSTLQSKAS